MITKRGLSYHEINRSRQRWANINAVHMDQSSTKTVLHMLLQSDI